jgi:hypothetical protein
LPTFNPLPYVFRQALRALRYDEVRWAKRQGNRLDSMPFWA